MSLLTWLALTAVMQKSPCKDDIIPPSHLESTSETVHSDILRYVPNLNRLYIKKELEQYHDWCDTALSPLAKLYKERLDLTLQISWSHATLPPIWSIKEYQERVFHLIWDETCQDRMLLEQQFWETTDTKKAISYICKTD